MGDNLADVDLGTDRTAVHITCGRWHTCVVLDNEAVKVCFWVFLWTKIHKPCAEVGPGVCVWVWVCVAT